MAKADNKRVVLYITNEQRAQIMDVGARMRDAGVDGLESSKQPGQLSISKIVLSLVERENARLNAPVDVSLEKLRRLLEGAP